MEITTTDTASTLVLPETLDAYQVEDLKESLLKSMEPSLPLTLDGAQVKKIDGLCCQLLTMARQTCEERAIAFTLEPSDAMKTAFQTLGLLETMGIDS